MNVFIQTRLAHLALVTQPRLVRVTLHATLRDVAQGAELAHAAAGGALTQTVVAKGRVLVADVADDALVVGPVVARARVRHAEFFRHCKFAIVDPFAAQCANGNYWTSCVVRKSGEAARVCLSC